MWVRLLEIRPTGILEIRPKGIEQETKASLGS